MVAELETSPEKAKEIAEWAKKHKDYAPEGDGLIGFRHFDAMRIAGEPLLISHKLDTSGAQNYSPDYRVICGETIAREIEKAVNGVEFPETQTVWRAIRPSDLKKNTP